MALNSSQRKLDIGLKPAAYRRFILSRVVPGKTAILNQEIFETLLEAKVLVGRWKTEYNTIRPHSSLNYRPPASEAIKPECLENAAALS